MKKDQKSVLGFVIIGMTILMLAGCDLFQSAEFPSEFIGTWKRESSSYSDTRTFTKDTYRMSNQSNHWVLVDVSGDTYHLEQSNNRDHKGIEIIRYENGKLIIQPCTGSGMDNCGGTWIRR